MMTDTGVENGMKRRKRSLEHVSIREGLGDLLKYYFREVAGIV
jgi:hypothetical protein